MREHFGLTDFWATLYCDSEKNQSQDFYEVIHFQTPESEEVDSGTSSECVFMCTSLVPESSDRFHSYSIFMGLSVTDQSPMNMNILDPKTGAVQIGSRT
jgi:hypothetical protein